MTMNVRQPQPQTQLPTSDLSAGFIAPQCGHASASLVTDFSHSLQVASAISNPICLSDVEAKAAKVL